MSPIHHQVIVDTFRRSGVARARRLVAAMRATLASSEEISALLERLDEVDDGGPGGKVRNLDPEYLKTLDILEAAEAAAYLRSSTSTLAKYRMTQGRGPAYVLQSTRKVLYRRVDLDAWLSQRSRTSTFQVT